MDTGKRDIICRRDRNRVCNLPCRKTAEFRCARCVRECELSSVVETLRHYSYYCRESTLNFVCHGEGQHEFLASRACLFGGREHGAEIVTRVAEAAIRHI